MISVNRIERSGGFTIVELMITMLIGSILILGAVTFLGSATKSSAVQTALSGLNVSGRFGLDQIARDIRMSGYRDSDWTRGAMTDVVAATNGEEGSAGDTITLQYEGTRDCNYQPPVGGVITNNYSVVDGRLMCNNQPVTRGVEEMQIYLGEDTDANNVPNRWMFPGEAGLDMTRVVAVRIHLLVVTTGGELSTGAQTFYFDNGMREAEDDGQIRREYSMTVALRNPT